MTKIWRHESRFEYLLQVEKAVARAQARLGLIPRAAASAIEKKGRFKISEIDELEKTTKHDIIAFVTNVASYVGPHGRFVHFGMTSSDVLDTALSLQIRDAGQLLLETLDELAMQLKRLSQKQAKTLCAGRTHGMHAEPTTFGFKMAGHWAEFQRHRRRLSQALQQVQRAKLSGPVGTYSTQPEKLEAEVGKILKLECEMVATQVIPRDRHAELILAIAMLGSGLERLAVELRHLQRTEVDEAEEGFTKGQKGSSAMPHKKNPISAENLTGLARLLRSYAVPALENVALWHERDISHSSVERVMFPDAFILADYACDRMGRLLKDLQIKSDSMKDNMDRSQGRLFSSQVLLKLIEKGLKREAAYGLVQSVSHGLKPGQQLERELLKNSEIRKLLKASDLRPIFAGKNLQKTAENRIKALSRYRGE